MQQGKVTKADLQASAKALANRALGKQGTHPTSVIELKAAVKSTPKNVVDAVLGTPGSIPTVQKIHLPGEVKRMPKDIRKGLYYKDGQTLPTGKQRQEDLSICC